MTEAPGREQGEAARDERRAATVEREAPDPAAQRPAVAGVIAEWLRPRQEGLGASRVKVYCLTCREPQEVPDEVLDLLDAPADLTCLRCCLAAWERRDRRRAARWGRERGVALTAVAVA